MTPDVIAEFKRIAATINDINADRYAHQGVLMAVIAYLATSNTDWRDHLSVMRGTAERSAINFRFTGVSDGPIADAMRQAIRDRSNAIFDEVDRAIRSME